MFRLFAATIFLTIDPRVAFVTYVALLLAAAGPVVVGWLRLLPAEREPFAAPGETVAKKPNDAFAIFLLANISLSLILRIPAVEHELRSAAANRLPDNADQAVMFVFIWFGFVPALAAAYSAVRANPIRVPLIVGGVLTLALWLAGAWLLQRIAGNP